MALVYMWLLGAIFGASITALFVLWWLTGEGE